MEKFEVLTGIAAPLMQENVNTDAIIPADWLRSVDADHAEGLFGRWRYLEDGRENPDFVLNQAPYRNARILVAGSNFGCGSSRENAVWALAAYGIRCVMAPSFGDIFRENCVKNGVLPIVLAQAEIDALVAEFAAVNDSPEMEIDLVKRQIKTPLSRAFEFSIEAPVRDFLLAGMDEIDRTLAHMTAIQTFQSEDRISRPWAYPPAANTPTDSSDPRGGDA